jgi:hypothetical protein
MKSEHRESPKGGIAMTLLTTIVLVLVLALLFGGIAALVRAAVMGVHRAEARVRERSLRSRS